MSALITLPADGKRNYFVFGSNENGYHGAGAARFARVHYNAKMGVAVGHTGDAYAIPTMDKAFTPLPLPAIGENVKMFLYTASLHPDRVYYVTPIACGIAGYGPREIAPFFADAPSNVVLPDEFTAILSAEAPRT
jgi:hypothetical protein